MENLNEIEELLSDAHETLIDKKNFAKTMNKSLKECAKINGIDVSLLKRCKDYKFNKGKNWLNNNPLEKDPTKKDKDKISPVFIKLREIFEDLNTVGELNFLDPYLNKLSECGITISYNPTYEVNLKQSKDEIKEVLDSACKYQLNVSTLNEELKETKSTESEELGFTPKGSFVKVLSYYDKIMEEKDVEDKIQDEIANNMMLANACNYLSSKINKSSE